jgi:hypothetical protein
MEQQQKAAERQEEQRRSSAAMLPGSSPGVNIPHQHTEIPTSVFKVGLKYKDLIDLTSSLIGGEISSIL